MFPGPVGDAAAQDAAPETEPLATGRYATMSMLLERTIFAVDVLRLEIRVDTATARRLQRLVTAGPLTRTRADSIAAAVLDAPRVTARIRFERGIGLDRFLQAVRENAGAARDAGFISPDEFRDIADDLPGWYAFLRGRGIRDGDVMTYDIRADTLRTTYRNADGVTLLDQTDVGRFRRLVVLGGYVAPGSDFRDGLIGSLYHRPD